MSLFQKTAVFFEKLSPWAVYALVISIPLSTAATNIFSFVALGCALFSGNLKAKYTQVWPNPLTLPALLLFSMLLVSMTYTVAPFNQAFGTLKSYIELLFIPLWMPLFFEEKIRHRAMDAFLAAMVLSLVYGIYKFIAFTDGGRIPLHFVSFRNHIQESFLMTVAAYLLIHRAILSLRTAGRLLQAGLATLMFVYIFYMMRGRTGYVIALTAIGLIFVQHFKFKGIIIGSVTMVLLALLVYYTSPMLKDRVDEAATNTVSYQGVDSETSMGERLTFYHTSLKVIKENPVLGVGVGGVRTSFNQHGVNINNPHNEYLNMGVQLGIVGILLLLYLFFTHFRTSLRLPPWEKFHAQGILAIIMLGSLANSWLTDTVEAHLFAYMTALTFACLASAGNETESA